MYVDIRLERSIKCMQLNQISIDFINRRFNFKPIVITFNEACDERHKLVGEYGEKSVIKKRFILFYSLSKRLGHL